MYIDGRCRFGLRREEEKGSDKTGPEESKQDDTTATRSRRGVKAPWSAQPKQGRYASRFKKHKYGQGRKISKVMDGGQVQEYKREGPGGGWWMF